jgi:hypothetical protein
MRRLDDDTDAMRFEHFVDGIGNLGRHLFLDLQALGSPTQPNQTGAKGSQQQRRKALATFGRLPRCRTKLFVSWHVGDRSQHTGVSFMDDKAHPSKCIGATKQVIQGDPEPA